MQRIYCGGGGDFPQSQGYAKEKRKQKLLFWGKKINKKGSPQIQCPLQARDSAQKKTLKCAFSFFQKKTPISSFNILSSFFPPRAQEV